MWLKDEDATIDVGHQLAKCLSGGAVVFLRGHLGAGKTTLSRGILQGLGHHGAVKSPTYTLVEPYQLSPWMVYHFDLYRLGDPEELEYMGIRDYFSDDSIALIEWDERGAGMLPAADLVVTLVSRSGGRDLTLQALSPLGESIAANLKGAQ